MNVFEILIFSILFLMVYKIVSFISGVDCWKHSWEKHGPTEHMYIDTKTKKLSGHKRMWWVCSQCGRKKPAEKSDEIGKHL